MTRQFNIGSAADTGVLGSTTVVARWNRFHNPQILAFVVLLGALILSSTVAPSWAGVTEDGRPYEVVEQPKLAQTPAVVEQVRGIGSRTIPVVGEVLELELFGEFYRLTFVPSFRCVEDGRRSSRCRTPVYEVVRDSSSSVIGTAVLRDDTFQLVISTESDTIFVGPRWLLGAGEDVSDPEELVAVRSSDLPPSASNFSCSFGKGQNPESEASGGTVETHPEAMQMGSRSRGNDTAQKLQSALRRPRYLSDPPEGFESYVATFTLATDGKWAAALPETCELARCRNVVFLQMLMLLAQGLQHMESSLYNLCTFITLQMDTNPIISNRDTNDAPLPTTTATDRDLLFSDLVPVKSQIDGSGKSAFFVLFTGEDVTRTSPPGNVVGARKAPPLDPQTIQPQDMFFCEDDAVGFVDVGAMDTSIPDRLLKIFLHESGHALGALSHDNPGLESNPGIGCVRDPTENNHLMATGTGSIQTLAYSVCTSLEIGQAIFAWANDPAKAACLGQPTNTCGDSTGEGVVSATDALQVLQLSVQSELYDTFFDVAEPFGRLTATDSLRILQIAVGSITVTGCGTGASVDFDPLNCTPG